VIAESFPTTCAICDLHDHGVIAGRSNARLKVRHDDFAQSAAVDPAAECAGVLFSVNAPCARWLNAPAPLATLRP
jgi:hypothetical protein